MQKKKKNYFLFSILKAERLKSTLWFIFYAAFLSGLLNFAFAKEIIFKNKAIAVIPKPRAQKKKIEKVTGGCSGEYPIRSDEKTSATTKTATTNKCCREKWTVPVLFNIIEPNSKSLHKYSWMEVSDHKKKKKRSKTIIVCLNIWEKKEKKRKIKIKIVFSLKLTVC